MAFQARLLAALSDPDLSLREVADRLSLPLDQLSLVLTRPDLVAELAGLDSLAAARIRLVATSSLPAAADAVRRILTDFNSSNSNCSRETALRAARLLLRLSNFAPGPVLPRPASSRPPAPTPPGSSSSNRREEQIVFTPPGPPSIDPCEMQADVEHAGMTAQSNPSPMPAPIADQVAESMSVPIPRELPDGIQEELSAEEQVVLAAQLIREGAFTQEQLGDVYRFAAEEFGYNYERIRNDPAAQDACIAQFLAVADEVNTSFKCLKSGALVEGRGQPEVDQLACVPP